MRVALMIEGQEGVSWEQWCALADACEEHGVETLFRSDHYISQSNETGLVAHDAWTTLAGLAARTSKLRFGTLVSPATFRLPALLANAAATVDHISGGRIELGLGAGWMELEHRAYGFPFPETSTRLRMFAEQLEIVHRLWTPSTSAARTTRSRTRLRSRSLSSSRVRLCSSAVRDSYTNVHRAITASTTGSPATRNAPWSARSTRSQSGYASTNGPAANASCSSICSTPTSSRCA
jgi:alkanesulfonate monooxygenase SsuD/methylene tetrahydromethanopterin reductase-like flavin-dependent oxidoreductase (luciferase family)